MAAVEALRPQVNGATHSKMSSPAASHPAAVTVSQVAIVKATAPVLEKFGVDITTVFYNNMLEAHPDLKNIFNMSSQASGRQPRALAAAVLAYASHIDDLPALRTAVERIALKHTSLGVKSDQYAIVGKHLIDAIGTVLGDAATPEIVDAWTAAYGVLADVFINREKEMYNANEEWSGWRRFRIVRRERETGSIDSFYLAPVDGITLPSYLPGQYVSLQVFVPEIGYLQSRQYSLSQAPREEGDFYRVSIRRDDGDVIGTAGMVSNLLHDNFKVGNEVEITHPQGEFFVDPLDESKKDVPLVLISAGVGATPVMSILDSVTRDKLNTVRRPVSWIYASRTRSDHIFAEAVRRLLKTNEGSMSSRVFLRQVSVDDIVGTDYDFGDMRMDLSKMNAQQYLFADRNDAEYYICGPQAFMLDMRQALADMGVARERIHLELFATGDVSEY